MASGPGLQLRLTQLKKDVLHVLSRYPDGIETGHIWNKISSELGRSVKASQYGVKKLSDVLKRWDKDIEQYTKGKKVYCRIRKNKPPSLNEIDFPPLDEMLSGANASGPDTKSNKPSKYDQIKANMKKKESEADTVVIHVDVENDAESQKPKGTDSKGGDTKKDESVLALEVKRKVIDIFTKHGPSNTLTLVELLKLVREQLGDISHDRLRILLEMHSDIFEIFNPAGQTKNFESCRLKDQDVTRIAQGESVNALLNKPSTPEANKPSTSGASGTSDNVENKKFELEFGVFLRDMLKFFPNGCSVHVIMQNHELQKRFPVLLRMTPFEIHRLLSNTEGVWFDGTLCYLALSKELMKKVQITALQLISNGNFGGVMVPYLAEMIRRTDISLSTINNMQVAQVLEATCVPHILFRNGEVYYRVQGCNLDQVITNLVKGEAGAATAGGEQHDIEEVSSDDDDEDDDDASSDEAEEKEDNREKQKNQQKQTNQDKVANIPADKLALWADKPQKTPTETPNDSSDEEEDESTNKQTGGFEVHEAKVAALRNAVIEGLSQYESQFGTGLNLSDLKKLLKPRVTFSRKELHRYCLDNILKKDGKLYILAPQVRQKKRTAMELMSSLNSWGKPAGADSGTKSGDQVIDLTSDTPDRGAKSKQVLKQDFISFDMDSSNTSNTIDLTGESPAAKNTQLSQSYHGIGNMPVRFPVPGPQLALGQGLFSQGQFPNLLALQRPMFSQGLVPPQGGVVPPKQGQNLAMPITAMDCTPARNMNSQAVTNNPFAERMPDGKGPGFRDVVVDLTVQPIVKKEFERKEILAQPVYVPRGQRPSPDMVESIARECIESLADANEYVSPERIDKLLLQRFGVNHVRQLGFQYPDKISCINDVSRLINKINGYVYAFVKTRCICTLFELRECLREFVPNKEDFSKLKLGPLQRFPVVFEQFRFPPDQETIPEITSTDILEHFRNYLSKKNLWTSRLELEDFMNYLVETFGAENAYYLGVRIRSLPLAAQVLKKAQRDAGNSRREIFDHFKQSVRSEIDDAFRKFRAGILESGEGEGLEVRKHYLKLRPELAITEIFEKFNLLLTFDQPSNRGEKKRHQRIESAVQEFISTVKQEPLARSLLHLAICITNTVLEESAMELLAPGGDKQENVGGQQEDKETKPPPKKDSLLENFKNYVERCLNVGALSLSHLNRIEEKLLEDFGFDVFHTMGYGRFLEFILREAKQVLEESGGLTLGSSSGSSDGDVGFKPQQADLFEFIKQSGQCGVTQPTQVEDALCHQYGVKDVKFLGHGNINRLLTACEKHKKYQHTDFTVHYETALVAKTGLPPVAVTKVGMLGHQTKDAAKICLHNCPLLEDLAEWSQWGLIFEPEHGKLKDFIQKYGGVTTMNIEGGKIAHIDIVALETRPGHLIKIAGNTSTDHFAAAINARDVTATCGHLVSLAVNCKGTENMPLALLAVHMKTALIQMHAGDQVTQTPGGPPSIEMRGSKAAEFVLKCLVKIPTKICVALANKVFLDPLGQAVGSTKSKQLLVQMCSSVNDLNHLLELGCLLGISEWTNVITPKCRLPDVAVQLLPPEIEEFLESGSQEEEESDTESQSSEESDIDLSDDEGEDSQEPEITTTTETGTSIKKEEEPVEKQTDEKDMIKVDSSQDEDSQDQESSQVTMVTIDSVDSCDDDEDDDVINDVTDEVTEEVEQVDPCKVVVDQIRKDEFGIGVHLSEDGQRLMKVQQERLGRSIDRLSKDLYSKDTHFVLELVQNADDNSYHDNLLDETTDDCPAVKFVIDSSRIMVLNNEQGFQEQNIRYLCDVGRSTKGKHKYGYIGQKGIGFKSVFRVTDTPEVHSNGYHIKFDVHSGPMGYILPHWLDEEPEVSGDWMTKIILPLKEDMRVQTRTLAARFHDIHPSLLLFLHRLRQITIENKVEGGVQRMRRYDLGDNIVEIRHSDGSDRWLVIKKMLDASKISLQAKSGVDVESTEIALAFPMKPSAQRTLSQVLPPKQKVFAFLPLRSYGFRFIVQGDFDVPSSREDVDRDSSWNQWLRNEIHTLFIEALEVFKVHPDFTNMESVSAFLQFVPMEDEILDFFKPVATQILSKLRARPCIPTQPNSQGVVSWKIPSQTVRVRDPLVREVITPELLQKHLNLYYLHGDVAAMLNPTLTSCLGIESLTSEHLFQLGKAMVVNMGPRCGDEGVITISRWLACMYRSLDEFHQDSSILDSLRAFRMLPLSDGELVSLNENTIFFPIMTNLEKQRKRDPIFYLQQDVNSLHPLLLQTPDNEVNSQVQKLLVRLGLKHLSPHDIINHHILPVLKSDQWKKKSREVLISYLVYIKEQTDKKPSVCNLDDLKDVAMVMTNQGWKNPSQEPVHFTCLYGNRIDLVKMFPGYDWVLLESCYLPDAQSPLIVRSWHDFFAKLGVEGFLSVKEREEHLNKTNIGQSPWEAYKKIWPPLDEFIVKDYYSPELEALIKDNKTPTGNSYAFQMRNLCTLLDQMWEGRFSRYCVTQVLDKDGKALKETETSFGLLLRLSAWLPAVQTRSVAETDGSVRQEQEVLMKPPAELYIRSETVQKYLSQKVLYLDVKLSMNSFYQFLGLKNSVTIETVKDYLLTWCSRDKPEEPAKFCTSLKHMKNIYSYLSSELKRQEFQNLLRDKPVYFVPDRVAGKLSQDEEVEVAGKMLHRGEIWLEDPTRLFDKYRSLLEEFHSEICRKRTILLFYRDRHDIVELFKSEGRIDIAPKVEEYLELLSLLCSTTTPKDNPTFADVLCIFTTIGHAMVTPPSGMPDEQTAMMALESMKQMVKKKVEKQKVFPTKKQVWVCLEDTPMIADNKEWEKMFCAKKGVHFLDLEDRSKPQHGRVGQRRIISRHQDQQIHPDHINIFIEVCGVKKLSVSVKTDVTPELIEPCLQLQLYFYNIIPAIQRFLMVRFNDIYEDLVEANTRAMLADAKFYQASKLDVTYRLSNLKEDTFEVRMEKCVISPPIFYFHKNHLGSLSDIIHEIARHFSGNDANCYALLRSFLTELSNIVNNTADDTVTELLQRYNADQLQIPDDELWAVEAPVIPEPEPEPEPEPQPVEEPAAGPAGQGKSGDGEFQLKSWPPVASNQNPNQVRKEKTDRPASNIWPPPKSKDYMRSVRDLPANIKVGEAKKEGGDDSQLPDNKGDNHKGENEGKRESDGRSESESRKRKLSENQGSEQEVKRLSSGEEKPGQTEVAGPGTGQGHSTVKGQGTAQGQGQPVKGEGHVRAEGQPQAVAGETEQKGPVKSPSRDREGQGSATAAGEGQEAPGTQGTPHPQPEGSRKRYRSYSGHTASSPKKQAPLQADMGNPVWTHLASDYTYDELGLGNDLPLPEEVSLEEESGATQVGYWGELLVYQYLMAQKAVGNIVDVIWSNQEGERGNPYDFEVHFADENGIQTDFIEVKSTMSDSKEVFPISVQQIKFADEKKDNFHIYRVFNAGHPEKVKLIRIHDLNLRLSQKQVKLCMMI